jgi:hypothetical protein
LLPILAGGVSESSEVLSPQLFGRFELVCPAKVINQRFPQAGHLLQVRVLRGTIEGKVDQFERTLEGSSTVFRIVLRAPLEGTFHFAADVRHLLEEWQFLPASRREIFVLKAQR